jgi:hypothetical protein
MHEFIKKLRSKGDIIADKSSSIQFKIGRLIESKD